MSALWYFVFCLWVGGKPSSLGAWTSPGVGRRPCRLNVQRVARIRFFPSPYETTKVMQDPIQTHDAFLV